MPHTIFLHGVKKIEIKEQYLQEDTVYTKDINIILEGGKDILISCFGVNKNKIKEVV